MRNAPFWGFPNNISRYARKVRISLGNPAVQVPGQTIVPINRARSICVDLNGLLELSGDVVENQDFLVRGHDAVPARATGKRRCLGAVWKGNGRGHIRAIAVETGDKQADHH